MPGNPMLRHQLTKSGAGLPKVKGVEGEKSSKKGDDFTKLTRNKKGDLVDQTPKVRNERKQAKMMDKAFPPKEYDATNPMQVDRKRMPKKAPE